MTGIRVALNEHEAVVGLALILVEQAIPFLLHCFCLPCQRENISGAPPAGYATTVWRC